MYKTGHVCGTELMQRSKIMRNSSAWPLISQQLQSMFHCHTSNRQQCCTTRYFRAPAFCSLYLYSWSVLKRLEAWLLAFVCQASSVFLPDNWWMVVASRALMFCWANRSSQTLWGGACTCMTTHHNHYMYCASSMSRSQWTLWYFIESNDSMTCIIYLYITHMLLILLLHLCGATFVL